MFGPTWKTARPVVFDLTQLRDVELNYSVHEKELLVIIHTLKKWCVNLLGNKILVYTDHRTLENFNSQKDLSRCQLCWQEFMSQYEMKIIYIKGEDNTMADTLSRIPANSFPDEAIVPAMVHEVWSDNSVSAILKVTMDRLVLNEIIKGYKSDLFCMKLSGAGMKGIQKINELWYSRYSDNA